MIDTILATLNPMAMLFICIAVGFILRKTGKLPESSASVMAKMENWIFCPALSFYTMATYFTLDTLTVHSTNLLFACFAGGLSIAIAIPLSCLFVRKKEYERGVYQYALTFGNSTYVGDPVVLALFGLEALAYYKIFCLPLLMVIYTWGINVLTVKDGKSKASFKSVINPPIVALFVGVLVGITGLTEYIPAFMTDTVSSLKNCMGPVAMLLAGATIAKYDFIGMLRNKKVYIATLLRLFVLPAIIIGVVFGVKEIVNALFGLNIGNNMLYYLIFGFATPLGMNTIVFPEAYGGNPETGASMVMISHTLCVITIPIVCALVTMLFGPFAL